MKVMIKGKDKIESNQIEQTVVVQAVQSVEELHWLLKVADENPFITGVVGWVDLKDKNVRKTLCVLG